MKVCLFCSKNINIDNKFCNRSCAASFNNKKRATEGYSLKDKKKSVNCLDCKITFLVGINSSNEVRCLECAYEKILNSVKSIEGTCITCDNKFVGCISRKYCDKCLHLKRSENSRRTILLQGKSRRSKNEICFAELCSNYFGADKIKTNETMFDGWDADVIIEHIKVAILWNGKWHYEKITKNHSVAQVQNRDRIKIKKIEEYNYIHYTIKDLGSYNKEFVESEFKKFCEYMGV